MMVAIEQTPNRIERTNRLLVRPGYGTNAINFPVIDLNVENVSVHPYVATSRPLLGMYRKVAVQLVVNAVNASGILTLQCSLDGANWEDVPESACNNQNAVKNEIPVTGGIVFAELHTPVFWRVGVAAPVAAADYDVIIKLNGRGEVGKDTLSRTR